MKKLENFEKIPKNRGKLYIAQIRARTFNLPIFDADVLYNSGEIYKLPFIAGAGQLSDNCYYLPIEGGFELYHMNGYLQRFYREVNGICEINNEWMPYSYTKKVLEYLRDGEE